jgi:hypothetical protein
MIPLQETIVEELAANNTERDARRRLDGAGYNALRLVRCRYRIGRISLKGAVPSYYHKQLAQEVVKSLPGVTAIDNGITVHTTGQLD